VELKDERCVILSVKKNEEEVGGDGTFVEGD
jgi:hypothetical protein